MISDGNSLTLDLAAQNDMFADAFRVLQGAVAGRAFPGASVAVTHARKLVAFKAFGRFTYDAVSPSVMPETVFDLASVTKVVATTSMAMVLYERGLLDLDAPVVGVVPEFASEDMCRNDITVRMLLAHSSGLPGHEKLYLRTKTPEELIEAALQVPLKADPGTSTEYSDIGFIVLGLALERMADQPINHFCRREIFSPLGMLHTTFNPPPSWKATIPPTADDQAFRKRLIQGEVNDENASMMGGVAPHAGLFSTAADLAIFANAMLRGGAPMVRPETLRLFTARQSSPAGTSRALGWDTPSAPSQSGKYFSSTSFGHLGFTGTSMWIDPERQVSVAMLTNRTWPDSSNRAIREVWPRFHDAVMETLFPALRAEASR